MTYSNLEEDRTWWGIMLSYIRNEPAMFIEKFRAVLIALPVIIGVTMDEEVAAAIVTIAAVVVSYVVQKKGVRDLVTPYWKVTEGVYSPATAPTAIPTTEVVLPEDE